MSVYSTSGMDNKLGRTGRPAPGVASGHTQECWGSLGRGTKVGLGVDEIGLEFTNEDMDRRQWTLDAERPLQRSDG